MNFGDNAKSYGVQLAGGASNGVFATGGVSRVEYDDIGGGGMGLGLGAGLAMDLNPAKTTQLCPLVSFNYQRLPTINTGVGTIESSVHSFGFGGAIGTILPASPTLDLVPFFGAQYIAASGSSTFAGQTGSSSDSYGDLELGAGFVVNHTLTIRPAVAIPVGLEGAKSTFEIAVSLNFGQASSNSSAAPAKPASSTPAKKKK